MVIEEMVAGQHRVDERTEPEPVRVILMNRSSTERRGSRADEGVCSIQRKQNKKLLQRSASLEIAR
jgi:hypothetical protein